MKILSFLLLFCSLVMAQIYTQIDKDKLFPEDKNGEVTLDKAEFIRATDELCKFACTPALRFENEADARKGFKDYQNLLIIVNALKNGDAKLFDELKFYVVKLNVMGQAHFGSDISYEQIAAEFEELIAKEPSNAKFYKAYGEYSLNSGYSDKAEAILTRALELGDESVNFALAALRLNKNDKDGAIKYLDEYVKFNPEQTGVAMFLKRLKEER